MQLTQCPQPHHLIGNIWKRLEVLRKVRCDTQVKCGCNERRQGLHLDPARLGWHAE